MLAAHNGKPESTWHVSHGFSSDDVLDATLPCINVCLCVCVYIKPHPSRIFFLKEQINGGRCWLPLKDHSAPHALFSLFFPSKRCNYVFPQLWSRLVVFKWLRTHKHQALCFSSSHNQTSSHLSFISLPARQSRCLSVWVDGCRHICVCVDAGCGIEYLWCNSYPLWGPLWMTECWLVFSLQVRCFFFFFFPAYFDSVYSNLKEIADKRRAESVVQVCLYLRRKFELTRVT